VPVGVPKSLACKLAEKPIRTKVNNADLLMVTSFVSITR
jgi:hypothetical protein